MDSPVRIESDPTVVLAHVRAFRLGAVEVRPPTREIVGPRGREVLEPKVMQVLVALARSAGEFVTRDDLIASCWDGRIVGEDAITRVISRLRRHTEGVGRDGWTLETVTKVGYRLLPVGETGELSAQPVEAASPAVGKAPDRRLLLLGGGGAALAAAAVGGVALWRRPPEPSARAKALYEKGREALRQGLAEPTAQAVGFLREAVAEDPEYAAAWGALARAYQTSITFTEPARQAGVEGQARAAAERALALDPREPQATAALALLVPIYRNWAEAEALHRRALVLTPDEPLVALGYNKLLCSVGRIADALRMARIALKTDPFAPYHHYGVGVTLWMLGRSEEAERTARDALELWPRHLALWFLKFHILAYGGRGAEAIAFAADVQRRPVSVPDQDFERSLVAVRALVTRDPQDIARARTVMLETARQGVGFTENSMQWLSAMGLVDDAFAVARGMYFGEGFTVGDQRYSAVQGRFNQARKRNTYQLFMPSMAATRGDPRFATLVREVGLVGYWRATRTRPDDRRVARAVGL